MTTEHPPTPDDPWHIVPARMLNEWTYCQRLGALEWMHSEWADSVDTVDGRFKHRRVDQRGAALPDPDSDDVQLATRSVWLTSEREGLTAKMDIVEIDDDEVVVVDYKRGHPPRDEDCDEGVWEPERVQLAAQALVLRDHGYRCEQAMIYFVDARQRVEVELDDALIERTRALAASFRAQARRGTLPEPLDDSPKCPRCSLVGICLPDETRLLSAGDGSEVSPLPVQRQLLAPHDEARPLYVTEQGSRLGKRKGELVITARRSREVLAKVRWRETSQIALFGSVGMTTPAIREAMRRGVPVCWFSQGGWFYGSASGHWHRNVTLRIAQFRTAADEAASLAVAREIVRSKIRNQRTMLRRNAGDAVPGPALAELRRLSQVCREAGDAATLLGLEGAAARLYFKHLGEVLTATGVPFDFQGRNRRPPRDPVNALLSYAYAMLVKDATVALSSAGFDPHLGLYHRPRYGRPSLALDLMEEFRPLVADSVVLTAVRNGEVDGERSFVQHSAGCALTTSGKRSFLRCYERRMGQSVTHPIFGYRVTWRRMLEVQARLLGRHLLGEIPRYVPIETR